MPGDQDVRRRFECSFKTKLTYLQKNTDWYTWMFKTNETTPPTHVKDWTIMQGTNAVFGQVPAPKSSTDSILYVVFEREAREFQSYHVFMFQQCHSNYRKITSYRSLISQEDYSALECTLERHENSNTKQVHSRSCQSKEQGDR